MATDTLMINQSTAADYAAIDIRTQLVLIFVVYKYFGLTYVNFTKLFVKACSIAFREWSLMSD